MINVSNEFRERMKTSRDFYCGVRITLTSGVVLEPGDAEITVGGSSVTDASGGDGLPLGEAISRSIQIELLNGDEQYRDVDFFGASVKMWLTYRVSETSTEKVELGTFTVTEPETYGETVTITAYDDMWRADKPYATSLSFPATLAQMFRDICQTCGIQYSTSVFTNSTFVVDEKPQGEYTCRRMLGYIAMLAGGNAHIDRFGECEILTYDIGADVRRHELDDWISLRADTNDIVITGVSTVADGSESGDEGGDGERTFMSGGGGYVLSLENPLFAGHEQAAVDLIGGVLTGVSFRRFEGELPAYPLAEFMDAIKITDRRGSTYTSVITDMNFTFFDSTSLACSAAPPVRNASSYTSPASDVVTEARRLVARERTARETATAELARKIESSGGLYSTEEKQPDNSTIYYLHDKPTIAESQNVIRVSSEAIGFSTDGGKSYPYGLTIDGETVTRLLYAEGINGEYIEAGTITADALAADSVTADKLAANAVTAGSLAADAVTADKLAANAVTAGSIAADAVTADKLAANAVTADALAANSVTADALAANSVTADKLAASVVEIMSPSQGITALWNENEYGGGAATPDGEALIVFRDPITGETANRGGWVMWQGKRRELPRIYVNPNSMCPFNVTIYIVARLSSASATSASSVTPRLVWYNGGWKSGMPNATTSSAVSDWTWVEATDIVLGSFVEPAVEAPFVDCELYTPCLSSRQLTKGATAYKGLADWCYDNDITYINGGKIYTGTIKAAQIAANAITADKISSSAVTAGKIAAGAITADKIGAKAVTAEKLSVDNLSAVVAKLATWSIDSNSIYDSSTSYSKSTFLSTGTNNSYKIGGSTSIKNWVIGAGGNFGVTKDGNVYCSSLRAQGYVTGGSWESSKFVTQLNDLGLCISGAGQSAGSGIYKAWIIQMNSSGNLVAIPGIYSGGQWYTYDGNVKTLATWAKPSSGSGTSRGGGGREHPDPPIAMPY